MHTTPRVVRYYVHFTTVSSNFSSGCIEETTPPNTNSNPLVRGSQTAPAHSTHSACLRGVATWATPRPPRGSLGWPTSALTSARSAIATRWAIRSFGNGAGAMRSWPPPNRRRWRSRCHRRRWHRWRPGQRCTAITTHTLANRSHNCEATIGTHSFGGWMLLHECRRQLPMSRDTFYRPDWARPSFGMR